MCTYVTISSEIEKSTQFRIYLVSDGISKLLKQSLNKKTSRCVGIVLDLSNELLIRVYEENFSPDVSIAAQYCVIDEYKRPSCNKHRILALHHRTAHRVAYHESVTWIDSKNEGICKDQDASSDENARCSVTDTMKTINTQVALRSLMSISIAAPMLGPGTYTIHPPFPYMRAFYYAIRERVAGNSKGAKAQGISLSNMTGHGRPTHPFFVRTRTSRAIRTACLSGKHSGNFHPAINGSYFIEIIANIA